MRPLTFLAVATLVAACSKTAERTSPAAPTPAPTPAAASGPSKVAPPPAAIAPWVDTDKDAPYWRLFQCDVVNRNYSILLQRPWGLPSASPQVIIHDGSKRLTETCAVAAEDALVTHYQCPPRQPKVELWIEEEEGFVRYRFRGTAGSAPLAFGYGRFEGSKKTAQYTDPASCVMSPALTPSIRPALSKATMITCPLRNHDVTLLRPGAATPHLAVIKYGDGDTYELGHGTDLQPPCSANSAFICKGEMKDPKGKLDLAVDVRFARIKGKWSLSGATSLYAKQQESVALAPIAPAGCTLWRF